MRIAFLADIHGNLFALEAVLADCRACRVEGYVFLGDLVMIGSRPREVFQTLEALKPLAWIKGNTDGWLEEIQPGFVPSSPQEAEILGLFEYGARHLDEAMRTALSSKPMAQRLDLGGAPVMICHGSPCSYSQGIRPGMAAEELDACLGPGSFRELVCAHTHIPMNFIHRGVRFLNFGSVSTPPRAGTTLPMGSWTSMPDATCASARFPSTSNPTPGT